MKKILTFMLAVVMMLTAIPFAGAVEIPQKESSAKLGSDLKLKLEEVSEEDIVGIWVWFTYGLSGSEIDRLTIEKYGPEIAILEGGNESEKVNRWRKARLEVAAEFYDTNNERVLSELEIQDSERDFVSSLTPSAILYVPAYKVLLIAEHPEISGIDYYSDEEPSVDYDGEMPEVLPPILPTEPTPEQPEVLPTEPTPELPEVLPTEPSTEPSIASPDEEFYETDEFKKKFMNFCTTSQDYSLDKVEIWDAKMIGDILVFSGDLTEDSQAPMDGCVEVLGDWVVNNYGYYVYGDGLCLYAYDGEKFYYIKEAWEMGIITDLSEVECFSEPIYVTRIGDVNRDRKIDVKDATALQKHLAELDILPEDCGFGVIYDFNEDNKINVKDATAIQKHIAGLE